MQQHCAKGHPVIHAAPGMQGMTGSNSHTINGETIGSHWRHHRFKLLGCATSQGLLTDGCSRYLRWSLCTFSLHNEFWVQNIAEIANPTGFPSCRWPARHLQRLQVPTCGWIEIQGPVGTRLSWAPNQLVMIVGEGMDNAGAYASVVGKWPWCPPEMLWIQWQWSGATRSQQKTSHFRSQVYYTHTYIIYVMYNMYTLTHLDGRVHKV